MLEESKKIALPHLQDTTKQCFLLRKRKTILQIVHRSVTPPACAHVLHAQARRIMLRIRKPEALRYGDGDLLF